MSHLINHIKSLDTSLRIPGLPSRLANEGYVVTSNAMDPNAYLPRVSSCLWSQPDKFPDAPIETVVFPDDVLVTHPVLIQTLHGDLPSSELDHILSSVKQVEIGAFTAFLSTHVINYSGKIAPFLESTATVHRGIDGWVYLGINEGQQVFLTIQRYFEDPAEEADAQAFVVEALRKILSQQGDNF